MITSGVVHRDITRSSDRIEKCLPVGRFFWGPKEEAVVRSVLYFPSSWIRCLTTDLGIAPSVVWDETVLFRRRDMPNPKGHWLLRYLR